MGYVDLADLRSDIKKISLVFWTSFCMFMTWKVKMFNDSVWKVYLMEIILNFLDQSNVTKCWQCIIKKYSIHNWTFM